jgi:alkanesulfonate monooxygenase SsuD/methylene tetrahydromethanopterin reductase-like flavin-dependent oxidoreductase (luciferase family)
VRYGVVGSWGTLPQILEMASVAEENRWDGFFTWDGISLGEIDTYDPWTLLGALAVTTSRMTLGAMIFPLARRRPWKVARESITVDRLSGGRFVLPVGLGAANDDAGFARVSGEATERRTRAELLDETLEILDLAWRGERFDFDGRHYHAHDIVFRPTPVAQPRIPVWAVAPFPAPRSMARAMRWDGVIPSMQGSEEHLTPEQVTTVRDWLAEHRPADAGPFELVVEGVSPDDPAAAAEHLAAYEEAGATWWIESRWAGEVSRPDRLLARIAQGPVPA